MNHFRTIEFDTILEQLADCAVSAATKERCLHVTPADTIEDAIRLGNQTTEARRVIEHSGNPPVAVMTDLGKIIVLLGLDAMLTTDNISDVATFLASCERMKVYLKRAEATNADIALYGNSMLDLAFLEEEINRCVRNGRIDDKATAVLYDLRHGIERKREQIREKVESVLKANKAYCTDNFAVVRNGRYTIPVQKKFKNKIQGVLVEMSNAGGTCFIEPAAVSKLQDELALLKIEEDNEIRVILYTLTALIADNLPAIKTNMEAMEVLDFVFAKAKLSIAMDAKQIRLTHEREIRLLAARHPLLGASAVPLDFALGGGTRGVVITGPNTGGKTVAIKTVGLLTLMAQSGLHVPADEQSSTCLFDAVWCDIGDGQSISQNLSTFSSHMTNIIDVMGRATADSLILFDELGSGTDPAEGMGIATAILEELLAMGVLFTVTTHYPEIKDFATTTDGIINARMAFDRESLLPLYVLEIGEAGESCALHIAQRLGMPNRLLERARTITYSGRTTVPAVHNESASGVIAVKPLPLEIAEVADEPVALPRSQSFNVGDSVTVYPQKLIGIVYRRSNDKGEIGVQIKGKKQLINHKRLKLKVAAAELYPDDYDFSIVFDSVANRKARRLMGKRHVEGNAIVTE